MQDLTLNRTADSTIVTPQPKKLNIKKRRRISLGR